MKKWKVLLAIGCSLTVAACGGGGGGTPALSSTTLTLTGTAATGLAIAGATVSGKCKVGTGTTTTLADGSYTLLVKDGQLPCVLEVTNPMDSTKLHTVVTGSGSAATANITPLTEMITARVLVSEPNVFFAAFDAAAATQKVTLASVKAGQTDVGLVLSGTVDTSAIADFISTPLRAATQGSPTSGDTQDKLLDALKLKLSSVQIGTLATALATSQTTDAIKQIAIGMNTAPTIPPTANAGPAQSVVTGTTVTLDASASSVGTGSSLTYAWTLASKPSGSSATLAAPTTAKPTFVADVAGSYVASVIVNDGKANSSAIAVTITVSTSNAAPVANAGVAQNLATGSVVTLDGSASSDANSDSLTYIWTLTSKPAGSTAALSSATSAKPTFTADMVGTYVASLTVNDGKAGSAPVNVSITSAVANVVRSGKVLTNLGGSFYGKSAVLQNNGKIVVTGGNIGLVRYNVDGSLDGTFGVSGIAKSSFGSNSSAEAVSVQSDGKLLVAGYRSDIAFGPTDFFLLRYNTDGTLDSQFGVAGKAIADFGTDSVGWGMALQTDGKILVVGVSVWQFAMARFNANGSLDSTFGTGGKVTTRVGPSSSTGKAVALQNDGKIVIAGQALIANNFVAAAARYNVDGSPDPSFGANGQITSGTTSSGAFFTGEDLAIQADGKILIAGTEINGNNVSFALARYSLDGSLDGTFGTGGKVTTVFGKVVNGLSVTLQADGKILLAGNDLPRGNCGNFILARYNTDGLIDFTFGIDGKVETDFGGGDCGRAVRVQGDGKIIVTGGSDGQFVVARYNTNGSLDTSFGDK